MQDIWYTALKTFPFLIRSAYFYFTQSTAQTDCASFEVVFRTSDVHENQIQQEPKRSEFQKIEFGCERRQWCFHDLKPSDRKDCEWYIYKSRKGRSCLADPEVNKHKN